ncbi:MAG TPA: hypothetical protein VF257_01125 [Solirubrobacteraceae bacterium]
MDVVATIAVLEAVERLTADLQTLVRRQLEALDAATPPAQPLVGTGRASLRESPLGELFRATDRAEHDEPRRAKKKGKKAKKAKKEAKRAKRKG